AVEPASGVPVQSNQPVSQSESFVTVLALEDGRLNKIGELTGLGKTEQIYSVRFIGDRGYVVTFRQTDPLYVIDLSDPKNPTVSGELKIPGFSSYLHPVGENLLLGVGQDATEEGRVQGSQISLFDVSDPKNPTRTSQLSLGGGSSEIQYDHHAFLFWQKTGLAVIPHQSFGPEGPFIGATAATIQPGTGLIELGRTLQPTGDQDLWRGQIRRSMIIGNSLYTISEVGVEALDPSTLASKTWVAFPMPKPVITDPYAEGKAPTVKVPTG
ncbi:MAG TPA: beta-propeller domain-containing protein, partial [Patescibacteria group bacterium]|nr:beta-propeller domain-containing protein [Patescibacteria group bacterium]